MAAKNLRPIQQLWIAWLLVNQVLANDRPSPSSICNFDLLAPNGIITTPNYPGRYPEDVYCQWKLHANESDGIQITITFFNLPWDNTGRSPNELSAYTTNPDIGTAIRVFSGIVSPGTSASFNSSVLWLTFQATGNLTNIPKDEVVGFSLNFNVYSLRISCKDPGIPNHGSRPENSLFLGSSVHYFCNLGFKLEGSKTAECITNNSIPLWSSELPMCIPSCDLPEVPFGGRMIGANTSINSNISYSCVEPLVLNGTVTITCIIDTNGGGAWNAPIPTCYRPDCSKTVTLTTTKGAIANPSYPQPSLLNKTCTWKVIGNINQIIRFTSTEFDIPRDDQTSIEFTDIANSSRQIFARFVGSTPIRTINVTSRTNEVEVHYTGSTIPIIRLNGFFIQYFIIDKTVATTPTVPSTTLTLPTTAVETTTTVIPTTSSGLVSTGRSSTATPGPASSTVNGTTLHLGTDNKPKDNSATNIAIGVTVPLFLLFVVAGFIFYKWYRRKYPVRMIIGRDFGKFENPDYQNRSSTLSLVRTDADQYFKEATSKHASAISLNTKGQDNLAFEKDSFKNYNPSDDEDLVKRKSFLFKSLEEHHDWMETEFTSSTSSKLSAGSVDAQKRVSATTESDNISDISNNNTKNNNVNSAKEQTNVHLSQEELHNIKNAREHFQKNSNLNMLPDNTRRARAYTQDEIQDNRPRYGNAISARFRSKSADPVPAVIVTDTSLTKENRTKSHNSVSSSSSVSSNGGKQTVKNDIDNSQTIESRQKSESDTSRISDRSNANSNNQSNRSPPSSVGDDSQLDDSLCDAELSDNSSVRNIKLSLKKQSESITSLRGDIDSECSSYRSRHASDESSEGRVISPESSFIVLPSNEISDGDSLNSTKNNDNQNISSAKNINCLENNALTQSTEGRVSWSSDTSSFSSAHSSSYTEREIVTAKDSGTRSQKSDSSTSEIDQSSALGYDEVDYVDTPSDHLNNQTNDKLSGAYQNGSLEYNRDDSSQLDSSLSNAYSNERYVPAEQSQVDSVHGSFSADSTSLHSTTISSVASYSSDEEGEYVINSESLAVSPSDVVLLDSIPCNGIQNSLPINIPQTVENQSSVSSSPDSIVTSPIPKHSQHDDETKEEAPRRVEFLDVKFAPEYHDEEEDDAVKDDIVGQKEDDDESENNEIVEQDDQRPANSLVERVSNVHGSDSDSGEDVLTDDDILKALEDCSDSSEEEDTTGQPIATNEMLVAKPRSISIDHNFKFDEGDDDIDV